MERFRKLGTQTEAHKNGVWAVAPFSHTQPESAAHFLTGGADGKLKTWRIRTESEIAAEEDTKDDDADAVDVDLPTSAGPCAPVATLDGHTLPVVAVAVARRAPRAASTALDGVVRVWNVADAGAAMHAIQMPNVAESWGVAMSADGQRVVTGGANGVVQLIDAAMGSVDQTMSVGQAQGDGKDRVRRENAMVLSVALSEDDRRVAVGAQDGSVSVLDVETGKVLDGKLPKHGGPVRAISYLPGEPGTIVTGSDDQLVNLYDADAGQVTGTCRGHAGLVLGVAGSPDGKYIVSGGSDRTVHVWDRVMRESVYNYKGHKEAVWGVAYAAGGTRIVAVADDASVSVLDSSKADVVA